MVEPDRHRHHHHHHRAGDSHPPATVHVSILRLSAAERMAVAAAVAALLWAIVLWAMG